MAQAGPWGPALAAACLRYASLCTRTMGGSGVQLDTPAQRRRAVLASCILCAMVLLQTAVSQADVAASLCYLRCRMHVLCLLSWFRVRGGCCDDSGHMSSRPPKHPSERPRIGALHVLVMILFYGHIGHCTYYFLGGLCFPLFPKGLRHANTKIQEPCDRYSCGTHALCLPWRCQGADAFSIT